MDTDVKQMSRRSFMGGMTATAALTAASYKRVLGANDRVGIGFIGFGLIGKQHVYNFKTSFKDVDRVAMCDVYKPRLEEGLAYMENPAAKGYTDFRKMYEDKNIDGVVVATPDHWHAMLTIMACAAGKDVYVEKPLTVFIDEGKWMLQAMNKYKRVVVVGTQRNHNPGHMQAKKIVESGVLGKIQAVRLGAGGRNIYPGFGKTPVGNSAGRFRLRPVARAGAQEAVSESPRPLPLPLVLGLLGRPAHQPRRPQRVCLPAGDGGEGADQGRVVGRTLHAGRRRRDARPPGVHLPVPELHDDDGRSRGERVPRLDGVR